LLFIIRHFAHFDFLLAKSFGSFLCRFDGGLGGSFQCLQVEKYSEK